MPDIGNAVSSLASNAWGGAVNTVMGVGQAALGVGGLAQSAWSGVTGNPDAGTQYRQASDNLLYGGTKMMSGPLQTLYSPISGVMGAVPSNIRKVAANTVGADLARIGGALDKGTHGVLSMNNPDFQSVLQNAGTLASFGMIKNNPKQFKQYVDTVNPLKVPGNVKKTVQSLLPKNLEKELVKRGFNPADAAEYAATDPETKKALLSQLQLAEKNQGRNFYGEPLTQPIEIAGQDVTGASDFVRKLRTTSGQEKGALMKTLPKDPLYATTNMDDFFTSLRGDGVKISKNGTLNFSKSVIPNAQDQRLLQEAVKDVEGILSMAKPFDFNEPNDFEFFLNASIMQGETYSPHNTERVYEIAGGGMIVAVCGPPKSRKTALITPLVASAISKKRRLVWDYKKKDGGIAMFDTEQGAYYFGRTQRNIFKQAGLESNPDNYKAFPLRKMSPEDRIAFIEAYLESRSQ